MSNNDSDRPFPGTIRVGGYDVEGFQPAGYNPLENLSSGDVEVLSWDYIDKLTAEVYKIPQEKRQACQDAILTAAKDFPHS